MPSISQEKDLFPSQGSDLIYNRIIILLYQFLFPLCICRHNFQQVVLMQAARRWLYAGYFCMFFYIPFCVSIQVWCGLETDRQWSLFNLAQNWVHADVGALYPWFYSNPFFIHSIWAPYNLGLPAAMKWQYVQKSSLEYLLILIHHIECKLVKFGPMLWQSWIFLCRFANGIRSYQLILYTMNCVE